MQAELKNALLRCGTDINGALYRFCNDEGLYVTCLKSFLEDTTVMDLERSIEEKRWDDAFTAVHALKGMAGNMGFIPLFYAAAETVVLIRNGKEKEAVESCHALRACHREIASVISEHCSERA